MTSELFEYTHDGTTLEGFLAWDDQRSGRRPGVLVIHEWMGIGPHEKRSCEELARGGYLSLAADIYGKGERPGNAEEAADYATRYRSGDRGLLRARARAGLEALRRHALCDPSRVAAIGYCFGGTAVLELARSGAEVRGAVSFHGSLGTPRPEDAEHVKASVLAFHGANDPYVPQPEVEAFEEEMRRAGVDWQLVMYGGAVHSFTNERAGDDPSKGFAYNARAAHRSWRTMLAFFAEIFA